MNHARNRKHRGSDRSLEPGQDSFLDVVANLIGILIILVMLIGTQARSVWEQIRSAREAADSNLAQLQTDIQTAKTSIARLKTENADMESAIQRQKQAAESLKKERDRIQLAIESMKTALDRRKEKLSADEAKKQTLITEAEQLKKELETIRGQTVSLEADVAPVDVIDHLPTPIAKTVFGEEVHFRLQEGRLVHVPLNELVLQMKSEWKVKAKKLLQTNTTIETVGPVEDFRLQYKLGLKERVQKTEHGAVRSNVPTLERVILLSTRDQLGETFENALRAGSQFSNRLRSLDPNDVTISVWIYPDSFGQFNELKRILYEKGFLCAGWPLPKGQPISGSPNGFRTAAQ